jgi:hypothetical protein
VDITQVARAPRTAAALAIVCLSILVMVLLAGCATTVVTSVPGTANATATTTATPKGGVKATPTSAGGNGPQSCLAIAGFGSATPVSNDGRLANVPFPTSAGYMTEAVDVVNSTGLYEVLRFDVCTPNNTANGIHSYYAGAFPSQGWKQASTYPYDGGYQAPCGDPYCWKVGSTPEFSSLENVQAAGNGFVTYRLRLAFPPTLPNCNNILPPGNSLSYHFWWDGTQPSVPVPPLSVMGLGDGHGVGSKTVFSEFMCSPGTASSVATYMNNELTQHGWSATSQSLCGSTGWVINGSGLAISWHITNPTDWELSYCQ